MIIGVSTAATKINKNNNNVTVKVVAIIHNEVDIVADEVDVVVNSEIEDITNKIIFSCSRK